MKLGSLSLSVADYLPKIAHGRLPSVKKKRGSPLRVSIADLPYEAECSGQNASVFSVRASRSSLALLNNRKDNYRSTNHALTFLSQYLLFYNSITKCKLAQCQNTKKLESTKIMEKEIVANKLVRCLKGHAKINCVITVFLGSALF